jgi:SAM-dependent methyltransferase
VSKVEKTDIQEPTATSIRKFSSHARDEATRQRFIIEMPEFIQKKAALISAHFLLPAGARVVDMGCETGEVTYVLATLNPRAEIIGIDRDPAAIEFARRTYKLPNLSFRLTDATIADFEDDSLDGIINSNMLHQVYSAAGYNPDEVTHLLEQQIRKLKVGGTMLIRDYVMPPEEDYVLLELPNKSSQGDAPTQLSDADLLMLFSQSARPLPSGGHEGFFIDEIMPRREGTRLFRLPHKWAIEFIHRKDHRANWYKEIREEYTFFTWQDFRRECAKLGMRMVFSAPYWNAWVVENNFKGHFQLYRESYQPLRHPATNYFIVTQKVADRQSLILEERRPSQKPVGDLQIMVVRDKKSGALHELVKRPGEYCDIVPYRVTPDNRLVIYVRSGYPRPIVNAVSRGSHNLDGKKWSGHLVEPVTMDTVHMSDDVDENRKMIFDYVQRYTGLRPKGEDKWYVGETYFPSPDRIDEAIEPVFVEVENPFKTTWQIQEDSDVSFTELGLITELDATDILLASQVGLLPEPRLELHVFDLMTRYSIKFPRWIGDSMPKIQGQPVKAYDPEEMLQELEPSEFAPEKRSPVHLKPVKSVFVEEGKVGRSTRGISAQDIEFIVTDDGIENIAVVIPVTRDWDDNLLVALDPKILPVPNRMGGDGAMLNAPSFVLPMDVQTIDDAKHFIAAKFSVPVEQVGQLGESYFTHVGVTPQRVYPFVVSSPAEVSTGPRRRYTMMKGLWRLWGMARFSGGLLKALARTQMMMDDHHDMALNRSPINLRNKGFSLSTEKVAVEAKNTGYSAVPSRILGYRAAAAPMEPEPAVEISSQEVQSMIENLVMPRVGKRLSQSYAQALSLLTAQGGATEVIHMEGKPATQAIDKGIDKIGDSLKQLETQGLDIPKGRF